MHVFSSFFQFLWAATAIQHSIIGVLSAIFRLILLPKSSVDSLSAFS